MRYIGNKERLLPQILEIMDERNIQGKTFFDFFSGTANVGKFFKELGYKIYSSDLMYFSYVLQRAYITNNEVCTFSKLLKKLNTEYKTTLKLPPFETVVCYLDQIEPVKGFIYSNYTPDGTQDLPQPRMFFSSENGMIIDAIRTKIEEWKDNDLINETEYFVLIACLIETVPFYANISGVYAAFNKKWDPRAVKKLFLRTIKTITNGKENHAFNVNSVSLLSQIETDILYLDPPYNQRQYAPNYHILETIAKYDNPEIRGVTGMRDYAEQKSNFCNAKKALIELDEIASKGKYKYLLLSYNSEGLLKSEEILETLGKYGEVELVEFNYLRYKSNNYGDSKHKKYILEQLYILKK